MKIHNQLEPSLTAAEHPAIAEAGLPARRSLYHPAAVRRLGRVLRGRYRLESLLGMGAMGEVYRAVDLRLEQPCAVKLVFPGAVFSLQAHRRFVNEARVVARLFHPNIVEVRDYNEDDDGTKFLVMELLEGQDLHELLSRQGRLQLPRAIEIVRAVGSALQYAHDLGIVHRDVKPNNIFLGARFRLDGRPSRELGDGSGDQIKVLDFGLAKLLTDPAREGQSDGDSDSGEPAQLTKGIIIGTPGYLSPEATLVDGSRVDARSDQWSLAVVAYQLLSGRLPFGNPNPHMLCHMICSEEPTRLRTLVPSLPGHIDAAIHTALSKQREDRFPKVMDFIRSLGNLPSLGRVDSAASPGRTMRPGGSALLEHPDQPARATAMPDGSESGDRCLDQKTGAEDSDPTEMELYLPGMTRPRLALLAPSKPGHGGVPEFVEPDRELCSLRVISSAPSPDRQLPRLDEDQPDPDLLVTTHYTAEQLSELSLLTTIPEPQALVQAAQDAPTAPYRFGIRSVLQLNQECEKMPLPAADAAPAPVPECEVLTKTLVPTGEPVEPKEPVPVCAPAAKVAWVTPRSVPPQPPPEAFAEPGQLQTLILGPRAAATLAAFTGKQPAEQALQTLGAVQTLFFSSAAAPVAAPAKERIARSPSKGMTPLSSNLLELQMPPLLTLPGVHLPELGIPLLFTPPPRRTLWHAVGAGSVVLGLVFAVLLGLRLARAKAISSGVAPMPPHVEAALAVPLLPAALPPPVQVAYAATEEPDRGLIQSLLPLPAESTPPLIQLLPTSPGASSSSQ